MSLSITAGSTNVSFTVWRRGSSAMLGGRLVALDTETESIVPGAVPAMVIASATDGEQGFFVARQDIGAFIASHPEATWLMHNAAFDLAVIDKAGYDTASLVDARRVFDTGLLYRLLKLADRGSCHGEWSLDHVCYELLGIALPKDVKSADGQEVRTTFGRFISRDGQPDYATLLKPEHRCYLEYAAKDPVATLLVAKKLNDWAKTLFEATEARYLRSDNVRPSRPDRRREYGGRLVTAWLPDPRYPTSRIHRPCGHGAQGNASRCRKHIIHSHGAGQGACRNPPRPEEPWMGAWHRQHRQA